MRIKSKYRSEGRAIYLKHSDGRVSVYAHLEDFSETIKKLIPKKRFFDIFPKNKLPIRKGDIIGLVAKVVPACHIYILKFVKTCLKVV